MEGQNSSAQKWTAKDYRSWWRNVENTLVEWLRAGAKEPAPGDLLISLSQIAGDLAVGKIPPAVAKVVGRGRSGLGPNERFDIGWGVAYINAVTENRITDDPNPIKTVAESFVVDRRTVLGWKQRVTPVFESDLFSPDSLRRGMEKAGRRYQEAGRSSAAIEKRAAKRRERKSPNTPRTKKIRLV